MIALIQTVARLAIWTSVAYLSSCGERTAEGARAMIVDRRELVMRFRGEYGRLCSLMAFALYAGHPQSYVIEAARGRGQHIAPVYDRLRTQRKRVDSALDACRLAHVDRLAIVNAGREAKKTVEGEWSLIIPMFSEATYGR